MPHQTHALTFDVAIATRNRPDALALTIPLLLGQSRRPEKLIVIDSSDDHAPVAQVVAETTAGQDIEVIVEHTEKGLTRQRNRALSHVSADVVFFPDDDTLFFPGTSAAIMDIYERDTERKVAAVNPAVSLVPPEGALDGAAYAMSQAHTREARTVGWRTRLGRMLPDINPRFVIGRILVDRAPDLPWMAELDATHVEWMTGFRMTFRTEALRAAGFEPVFGGYSLFEDTDASWAVTDFGCVLGTRRGQVYHHRFPSGRADRYGLGAMGLANLAYLMAKHSADRGLTAAQRREALRKTRSYARLRMLAARIRAMRGDSGAAEDLRGMKAAWSAINRLFAAPRPDLARTYLDIKHEIGID
ncbi:glycosyltransferase [Salipiger sp. 1_MG-2023]|uniref:glycosyltransferase family 2 protein n=1 Tax=Salipiger sp. 1_MG-2023 TaxID=3062665 RepID=UPI0026E403E0|nr:glycosyltransferase family 2 protein [Salipiger sp. 1_MG-2023]MDO6586996.1 glycosyltransferase [Salipiger sp. 1_MG-2023]